MEVAVYKNPLALRFIRCVSQVPNTKQSAGGAGFTLGQALKRLESEVIERDFHLNKLFPKNIKPAGIAAHFSQSKARENALQEVIESVCLRQIYNDHQMDCIFRISVLGVTLGVARTTYGYFALIRGNLGRKPVAAHSAGKSLFSTLMKVWEEYQSIRFFKPKNERLKSFTKANNLFSESDLNQLKFNFNFRSRYTPDLLEYQEHATHHKGRVIVYFCKSLNNEQRKNTCLSLKL